MGSKSIESFMDLPHSIRRYVEGKAYRADRTGKSTAQVFVFDDCVLKIDRISRENEGTVEMMRWLEGKLPVPKVIRYAQDGSRQHLLMSRVSGRMSCDEYYMSRPKELAAHMAEALRLLWDVDVSDCPRRRDMDTELKAARYRVENGLVDVNDVEPTTFGPGGFSDPAELLLWLENHRPDYEPVLSHGDLCLPNIFIDGDRISGIIDLSACGVGDKWRDIALCYRSLRWNAQGAYGGRVYPDMKSQMLFDALGMEPDMEKIRYYILLDELF